MAQKFTFEVDHAHGLIRIAMTGFFGRDDIAAFLAARTAAHAELGMPPNRHMTLNDVRGMKIQNQAIVQAFQDMLASPVYRSRRLAFVTEANLVRAQLMRAVAGRHDVRCFDSVAQAETWLFAEDVASAPSRRMAAGR